VMQRMSRSTRAEHGVAALGLLAAIAAIAGGAALGSVLVLSGAIDLVDEPAVPASVRGGEAQLLDCRGGLPVDFVVDGDSVFVVGVDESKEWVAIRMPTDVEEIGWLPASLLESEGDLSSLPVVPCGGLGDTPIVLAEESNTTVPPTATTLTTPPTTNTTVPTTATTLTTPPTTDTTTPPPPPDTKPPQVLEFVVLPEKIYPGADPGGCDSGGFDIYGSAYATVINEADPVTATLTWRYIPTTYVYSGSFPVSVEPSQSGFQLIGSISGLPQPYSYGISAPTIGVELTWTVTDGAGNSTVKVISGAFEVGRCV
jgi:hypothetical protein